MKYTRRKFLVKGGVIAAPVAIAAYSGLLSSLLSGCVTVKSMNAKAVDGKITVPRTFFISSNFLMVQAEGLQAPVYLSRSNTDQFEAVLMLCTHKGCVLEPAGDFLACPCHGSEFSKTGKVTKEPAERNLVVYRTSIDTENIYIHIQ